MTKKKINAVTPMPPSDDEDEMTVSPLIYCLSDQPDVDELDKIMRMSVTKCWTTARRSLSLMLMRCSFQGLPEGISQSQSFDEDFMMHNRVLEESEGLF